MEKLDLIQFDENGQAFVDWDALEVVTSKDFIDRIKGTMDFESAVVSIVKEEFSIEVLVKYSKNQVGIFRFFIRPKFHDAMFMNIYDLERYATVLGGEITWQK